MKVKRKIALFLVLILILISVSTFTVSAIKVGDIIGDVLYSDITAYINGNAIPTSVIQGKTLVVVEDLANYGFNVTWDNNERSLKIELNTDKKVKPLKTEINTRPIGSVKEQYFYTDIKTYLSGELVESYAIQGRTLIDFELLRKYGKLNWNSQTRELKLQLTKQLSEQTKKYIEWAKEVYNILYSSLKLPSSLTIYSIQVVWDTGFHTSREVLAIDYSAMNGFGGYNRQYLASWYDNDGIMRYSFNYTGEHILRIIENIDIDLVVE